MKDKKTKIIIAIVAVVVVVAAAIVAIVGFKSGWFKGEEIPEVSQVYDESGSYVLRDEHFNEKGELTTDCNITTPYKEAGVQLSFLKSVRKHMKYLIENK